MLAGVTAPGNGQEGREDLGSQLRSQGGQEEEGLPQQCWAWMHTEVTWDKEDRGCRWHWRLSEGYKGHPTPQGCSIKR